MFDFLKSIIWSLFRRVIARSSAEADNLTLRHRVAVLQRQILHRPKITRWDRRLFVALYRVQPDVLRSISIARPETVVRWHRAGFRLFWKRKSRGGAGPPRVPEEARALIQEISTANSPWREELLPLPRTGASNRFILNILGERRWRWVLRGLSRLDAGTKPRRLYQPSLPKRLLFPLAYWR